MVPASWFATRGTLTVERSPHGNAEILLGELDLDADVWTRTGDGSNEGHERTGEQVRLHARFTVPL